MGVRCIASHHKSANQPPSLRAITNQQASQGYENKDVMMRAGGCTTNTMQHGDVGKVANDSNCNGGQMAELAGLPTGSSGCSWRNAQT